MPSLRFALRKSLCAFALFGASLSAVTCGGTGDSNDPNDPNSPEYDAITHLYARSTTELKLEIDYQVGAEPYTGMVFAMDTWNLFKVNADALFKKQKTLTVPTMLSQMESLSDISGSNFSSQQILDIATKHRGTPDDGTSASFYVLFLDGYFNDGKMVRKDVLGVSIGKTGVIAMFKPVIASTSNFANIRKFVEQSTLIHEFGHAVGLVNNGVAMTTPHQDAPNGAHDMNDKCVMYYANEGASAAVAYAQQYVVTGNEILFDANCLSDTSARLDAAK